MKISMLSVLTELVQSVAIFHDGFATAYLSKAPEDVKSYDGSGDWFKIDEVGFETPGPDTVYIRWFITGKTEVCWVPRSQLGSTLTVCRSTDSRSPIRRHRVNIYCESNKSGRGACSTTPRCTPNVLRSTSWDPGAVVSR